MNEPKCNLGRGCPKHGFNEKVSRLLVNRAIELVEELQFTPEELVNLRRVSNGQG